MLSVKLVRSLVLGDTITNPFQAHPITNHLTNHPDLNVDDDEIDHSDDHHHQFHHHKGKKKLPILLFTPTKELISDTFRLATIARDIGMDFQPNSSLSHLLFSWPSQSPPSMAASSSAASSSSSNHRTSVSSNTSTFTTTSSSTVASTSALQNDAVPVPFPSLSTTTSLSLLRSFISLSRGLFKLVFLNVSASSVNPSYQNYQSYYHGLVNYGCNYDFGLFSRVSGKRVRTMEELSKELARKGWAMFRTAERRKGEVGAEKAAAAVLEDAVYLFRKTDANRVRVKGLGNGVGEGSRVRELRLPAVDFGKGVNLRVLLYILLMTDDVFYLA